MLNEVVQLIREEFAERHLQKHERPRAEQGERNRTEQNNERIAEAVELRGQDEKDQHDREQKARREICAFGAQLARFARIIDDVTFRQNVARLVLQKFQSGVERDGGHPLMRDGVELLHPIERTRHGFVLDRSDRAQRDKLIVRPGDVNVFPTARDSTDRRA